LQPALAAAQPEEEPTPDWQAFNLLPEDEEQADVAPRVRAVVLAVCAFSPTHPHRPPLPPQPRETLPPPPEYAAKQVVCARCYGLQHNGCAREARAPSAKQHSLTTCPH